MKAFYDRVNHGKTLSSSLKRLIMKCWQTWPAKKLLKVDSKESLCIFAGKEQHHLSQWLDWSHWSKMIFTKPLSLFGLMTVVPLQPHAVLAFISCWIQLDSHFKQSLSLALALSYIQTDTHFTCSHMDDWRFKVELYIDKDYFQC